MKTITEKTISQGQMKVTTLEADTLSDFIAGLQELLEKYGDMKVHSECDLGNENAHATIKNFLDDTPFDMNIGLDF